jgi:hypothetical protein
MLVAASGSGFRWNFVPPASVRLPRLQVRRLRMESLLANWQNRTMSSGGASVFGGFSGLALRQASPRASLRPVPSFGFRPFARALRQHHFQGLRPQNNGQVEALWNPSHFNQPRAITMGSTGRGVTSRPAKPGWLSGRAG